MDRHSAFSLIYNSELRDLFGLRFFCSSTNNRQGNTMRLSILLAIFALCTFATPRYYISCAKADLVLTVPEGAADSVNFTIVGTDLVGGSQFVLGVGTATDTFLSNDQALVQDATPILTLGGRNSNNPVYLDRNGTSGTDSTL